MGKKQTDDLDDFGGLCSFSEKRLRYYGADALAWLPGQARDAEHPASLDFELRRDSPVIDRGSAEHAPATDLRGRPRPAGAGVDPGAFESR